MGRTYLGMVIDLLLLTASARAPSVFTLAISGISNAGTFFSFYAICLILPRSFCFCLWHFGYRKLVLDILESTTNGAALDLTTNETVPSFPGNFGRRRDVENKKGKMAKTAT